MGPTGRGPTGFPSQSSNNGWSQPQPPPPQQQHQPPLQHHIPAQAPQFSQYQQHHHQQQHQQQQQARMRHQTLPGPSNPNIPNPISAIQHVKAGLQQRAPMLQTSHYPVPKAAVAKKVKTPSIEKEKIQTWHQHPIEKKALKKHKFSADVFPQNPQQEEDRMTPERIKRGFHLSSVIRDEGDTGMKHFAIDEKNEEFDEFLNTAAMFIQTISQKKSESMDKKKLKDISFVPFKDRQKLTQWLNDLAKSTSYHALAKKIPRLKSEECLEELFEHKIPIPHAVWFLKICHVGSQTELQQKLQQTQPAKSSKKFIEFIDYTLVFIKLIKELLDKVDDESTATVAKQKWKYYSMLIRHSVMVGIHLTILKEHSDAVFQEGLVNRQEFFIELADVLSEMSQKCSLEKMQLYRMIISFVSLFIRDIIKNVFIARKIFYYVGLRLRGYMDEYEKKKKARIPAKQVVTELLACNNHRLIVLTSFGILTSIIIDCPEACLWMPLDEGQCPPFIVGSPLDILPIDPLMFPTFLNETDAGEFTKTLKKLLASSLKKIHERNCQIDNRWALNCSRETGFQFIVRACLDVVSLLDLADLTKPRAIFELYAKVFGLTKGSEPFDGEVVIRVKAMLQWAITSEREGSHRALLVSKILQIYARHFRCLTFSSWTLVQVVVDFLNREAPQPRRPAFRKKYANLILLLVELQRAGLFSHDDYLMLLMKYNELKEKEPIIARLRRLIEASKKPGPTSRMAETHDEVTLERPVINFIPTPTFQEKNKQSTEDFGDHEFCRLKEEVEDDIVFLEKPDELTTHERLIVQLPIEQVEANRDAVNQRAFYLYGISTEREEVAKNLKLFGTNVINKWLDNVLRFRRSNKTVRRRSDLAALDQIFADFKTLTYYDRLCVTGYCMDGYLRILKDFIQGTCHSLPNIECFDMLLSMAEASQGIGWIMSFFLECFTVLTSCERIFDRIRTDLPPGTFATQQCFAIVGFLSEHYKYFLLSKEAIRICNGLYRIIERPMKADDYPRTCWVKAIAAFLIQARYDLRIRGRGLFAFRARDCRRVLPLHGEEIGYVTSVDDDFFISEDELTNQKIFSFHDLKKFASRLSSREMGHSFVVNAFALAREFRNDFAKLSELANFCGNISAVKSLESHWLNIIEALCTPHGRKRTFTGFDKIDNSMDYKYHYTYATFVTLLATRFCFSVHALFVRFNNDCLRSIQISEGSAESSHLLLTLQIIANIVTGTDKPFHLSKSLFYLSDIPFRVRWRTSDLRCLRILQIRELDAVILPVLLNIFKFVESTKNKYNLRDVWSFAWNTVLTITDQEWIKSRMFQICAVEKDLEDFVKDEGKMLLVIALRRESDREYKIDAMKPKPSIKSSMLKLFSILTIWNLRASYCDLKVMIREALPSKGNGNKNAQLMALASNFIGEIGRSCRDFFLTEDVERIRRIKAPTVTGFTFAHLNCYWLLSELVEVCTTQEFAPKSIKESFLEEVVNLFQPPSADAPPEKEVDRTRKHKIYANLLETQPFLNLIVTCQQGQDNARDKLIKVLLDHVADIKLSDSPGKLFEKRFEIDRAGMFLRINLVGIMLDFTTSQVDKMIWSAISIMQALVNGSITPERDGAYCTTACDMLLSIVLSFFTGSGQYQYDKDGNVKKSRYPEYANFIKQARSKFGDRTFTGNLQFLELLFPITAPTSEQPTFNDTFPINSPTKTVAGKLQNLGPPGFARNLKHTKLDKYCEPAQKRLQRFIYHTHQNDFFHPGVPGNPLAKGMLHQFVVGPPTYAEPTAEDRQRMMPLFTHQHSARNLRLPPQNFHGGQAQHPHPQQPPPNLFHERSQMPQAGGHPQMMSRPPSGPPPNMQMPSTSSMGMPPHQPNYNTMAQQPPPGQQMMPPQPIMGNNNPNGQMFNSVPPMHPPTNFGMPQPMNPRMQPQQHPQQEQMRPPINAAPLRGMRKRNTSGGATTPAPTAPKRTRNEPPMMNRPPMPGPQNPNQMPPSYYNNQQPPPSQQQGPSQQQPPMWDQQPPPQQRQPGMLPPPPQQQPNQHPLSQQQHPHQQPHPQPQQPPPMNFNSNVNRFSGGPPPPASGQGRMPPINPGAAQRPEDSDARELLRATLQKKMENERQGLHHIPPQLSQQQAHHIRQQQHLQQQSQMRHPSQQQPLQQQQQPQQQPPQQQSQMQMPQQQNYNPQTRM